MFLFKIVVIGNFLIIKDPNIFCVKSNFASWNQYVKN